ncbi:hypothetical protein [Streptomyces sp. NPDC059010]|uniref:hypothetical protein n=1 Tax=Streptomyces sp. NPDC059010 TaxID=3346695 RepID=UPI0036CBE4AE
MLKNSLRKIVLWVTLGLVFTAGAVSLLVLAVESWPADGSYGGSGASTSWYTTKPPESSDDGGTDGGGTDGGGTMEPSGPSEPQTPTPTPVVTRTVISVPENDGGGGGDGPATLIAACGSLLSGAAAVGTLLHAINLSRQNNRRAVTTDDSR